MTPAVVFQIPDDVQMIVSALQHALRISVTTGQITLNLTERTLQSVETRTYQKVIDKQSARSA